MPLEEEYNLRTAEQQFRRFGISNAKDLRILRILDPAFNDRFFDFGGHIYATTTSLPALTRESIDVPFQGTNLKDKGPLNFGNETTITFRNDSYLALRSLFEERMFADGNPLDGSQRFCTGSESIIQYVVLDKSGRLARGYQLEGVFISNVGEVQYDNSDGSTLTTFDVTFNFNYWCPLPTNDLDIDVLANDSNSANTNKSVIYEDHFNRVEEKLSDVNEEC